MTAAPILFGTDGIRSVAGEFPLEKPFVRKLGCAAGDIYRQEVRDRQPFFLLGRDTRTSGQWIAQSFAEGAKLGGVRVLDAGVTSTPSLAFLVPKKQAMGGVMISASHNPAEFNGIKLFSPLGRKCPDAWERLIEKRVVEIVDLKPSQTTLRRNPQVIEDYLDFLRRSIPPRTSFKGLKLVVDCSNGS